jgi:cytochrome c oxidase assembly protein subunit 15
MNSGSSRSAVATSHPALPDAAARAMGVWLMICCLLVVAILVVGGVTRLTHSGLSITEWQPIVGMLPPLSAEQWNEAFLKYQATPEYRLVNVGMSLPAFKSIFWWEYVHRLLGRVVGAAFALPLVWFAVRRQLPARLVPALLAIFALGALQGALGWYMVQSGLIDDPRVSQLRLAAHLGLALLIFAAMFWLALSLLAPDAGRPDRAAAVEPGAAMPLRRFAWTLVAVVFAQALAGSLVAGIHAGLAFNTFPLMSGQVVPPGIMSLEPWYRNFSDNIATVQFDHRAIAWLLALLVPVFWLRALDRGMSPRLVRAATLLLIALIVQLALGIATLLLVVPLGLAAAHQAGAVLVFAAALNAAHALRGARPGGTA